MIISLLHGCSSIDVISVISIPCQKVVICTKQGRYCIYMLLDALIVYRMPYSVYTV